MSQNTNPIGWLKASGSPYDIGAAMGWQGRNAVHGHLIPSEIWSVVTGPDHASIVAGLMESTRARFPDIHAELSGLAHGLGLPPRDVFAWNCRGDILATVPDGCTTVQTPGSQTSGARIHVSHNEDGLPFFRGHCFVLDAYPKGAAGFRSFCYPGSIAGHTFGWNDARLVQTVNNLRLQHVTPLIPRMVLGRAILSVSTLQGAIDMLSGEPSSGGFHMTLAQAGDKRLLSVEYGGSSVSVREITTRSVHANHTLHLSHQGQIITGSSQDRQLNGTRLIEAGALSDLDILRDTNSAGLPIRRDDPEDPDDENTLATCTFQVSGTGIKWRVYGGIEGPAIYQGE